MPRHFTRLASATAFLLLFAPVAAHAQQATTISGRVMTDGKAPLQGASVTVPTTGLGATTDAEGRYSFTVPTSRLRGPSSLTAHATPGHTPGSTTWTWDSCEGTRCLHMAYVDSVSAISDDVYRYTDEAQHPGVVAAFRQSIATIAALPCDVLLTPHPSVSNMFARIGAKASAPLVDANACRSLATDAGKKLDERIAKERGTPR